MKIYVNILFMKSKPDDIIKKLSMNNHNLFIYFGSNFKHLKKNPVNESF